MDVRPGPVVISAAELVQLHRNVDRAFECGVLVGLVCAAALFAAARLLAELAAWLTS